MKYKGLEIKFHRPLAAPKVDGVPVANPTFADRIANRGWLPWKTRPAVETNASELPRVPVPTADTGGTLDLDVTRTLQAAEQAENLFVQKSLANIQAARARQDAARDAAIKSLRTDRTPHTHLGHVPVKGPLVYRSGSPASSQDSDRTYMRTELDDPLGKVGIHIKASARQRLVESVSPDKRAALADVLDQIRSATQITSLALPSENSDGMASLPVSVHGQARTAFLCFGTDGRVKSVDVSHNETFVNEIEAVDAGGDGGAVPTQPGHSGSSSSTPPPLVAAAGTVPRVDIGDKVERRQDVPGTTRYSYLPRGSDVAHGIQVEARPNGCLFLLRVVALPGLSSTLGSGTDMVLGVARALNEDGYRVRQIEAEWVNKPGLESQFLAFRQSLSEGATEQEAAMSTFSGKAARLFGFTEATVEAGFFGEYKARFRRPATGV